ncbi:hypothetical protein BOX15_Mlig028499g1 [Macrostomum lignano]|uniref:Neurotransmitter-gated ion-channel ligand-binding domain-containing protein n=1 Tax=Macrostomum lignano TaxID=282301 RepID=A0A267DQK6_9PLAT|nr:hypothetical protein BOX15_Mlig028499g1 [Macrostomum lignano]
MICQLVCLLFISTASPVLSAVPQTVYGDLLANVLNPNTYLKTAMPICNHGEKLHVGQDMILYQLYDLEEPTQMLTVDVWVESTWRDCRLTWDPAAYHNVTSFAVKATEIWHPDLVFFESLHGNFAEALGVLGQSTARVRYDGMVELGSQMLINTFCRVDLRLYPFDKQRCNITFASWSKDNRTFVLRKKVDSGTGADHAFKAASNGAWLVEGFPAFNKIVQRKVGLNESAEPAWFTEVTFQLRLRRKPLYHQAYMVFPCALLTWLALLVYLLPAESGEKIGYVTTLLLSLVVFLLMLADNIPRSGDCVPILGQYFVMCVLLVALANVSTVLSYSLSLRSDEFSPPKLLLACLSLAGLCGLQFRCDGGWRLFTFSRRQLMPSRNGGAKQLSNSDKWRLLGIVCDRFCLLVYGVLCTALTIWIAGFSNETED